MPDVAIVRWTPANDLANLHSAMDRLFGDIFGESWTGMQPGDGGRTGQQRQGDRPTYHLPVNVKETESGYLIEAPVPGFRPEDVEVTFTDGVLTINARRQEKKTTEEGNYVRREVAMGHYVRQLTLPAGVQADNIKASFDHGMLRIEVPRAPRPQPRRIEVQAGQESEETRQLTGSASGPSESRGSSSKT
jgi:HSP20 family protein